MIFFYDQPVRFFKKNYKPEKLICTMLVIHAKNDKEVFLSQSKDFFKRVAGPKELYILENADHHLTHESYRQEVATAIDRWLRGG